MSVVETLLRRDRLILLAAMTLLFVLAAFYTLFGVGMDMTALEMTSMWGMRDMSGPREPGAWSAVHALLVFLMWWVMMIAMMLPSVAPTILLYAALVRRMKSPGNVAAKAGIFLAGYLAAWAAFSIAATSAQWFLEDRGIVSATMMMLIDTIPGAAVLIAAGAFQFTALKDACLAHCRSPAKFVADHYRPGMAGALRMGMLHGVYCLGCCWFLMALLFVGGIMNLYWIVGLAAFVALEKISPYGRRSSRFAGVLLVAWGLYVVIGNLA